MQIAVHDGRMGQSAKYLSVPVLCRGIVTKATLVKEAFNWELVYSLRGLVHDHHWKVDRHGAAAVTGSFPS